MSRRGFTLIELLISMAIGLLLVSMAFAAFQQTKKTIDRAEARLAMHQRMRSVAGAMRDECAAQMPNSAMFVRATPATATAGASLSLVFMRGKVDIDNWDWTQQATYAYNSDQVWCQWRFVGPLDARHTGQLQSGANDWRRAFQLAQSWKEPLLNKVDYQWKTFYNTPKPRRWLDPANPWLTLDDNQLGTPSPDDLGDGTELNRQTRQVIDQVTECVYELVFADGSAQSYDGSVARTDVYQGLPMDGAIPKLPSGDTPLARFKASEIARRPRLLRVRLTLTDLRLDLHQSFSFSIALPGLLPGPPP